MERTAHCRHRSVERKGALMRNLRTIVSLASDSPRRKRSIETDKDRAARLENRAVERNEKASAEDRAIDAAVKRSIEQHGA